MNSNMSVPFNPTEEQWNGLARDLMMWIRMNDRPTGKELYSHLESLEIDPPKWLCDEISNNDHVPSKGTLVVVIYKAMLNDYKSPEGAQ